jgi:Na+-driven multidrug efflux pump
MTIDLTAGKPSRVLLRFSLPMVFSVLLQQLYVLVDLFVVGNYTQSPEVAVSAVAAASSVTAIYTAVAVGFNAGCSVLIARLFGGK